MNEEKFNKAIKKAEITSTDKIIGTLSEKILHRTLKYFYEDNPIYHEIKVGSYYADICKDNKIFEIQTRQFNKLRSKLSFFLEDHNVTIIYPVFPIKWISWIDNETGEITNKRKSSRKGNLYDALYELYSIKFLLNNPNLSICLISIEIEEVKNLNGWGPTRKKRASRHVQIPLSYIGEIKLNKVEDYNIFIPEVMKDNFTVKDYQKETKLSYYKSQIAINVLKYLNIITQTGKNKRAYLYSRTQKL